MRPNWDILQGTSALNCWDISAASVITLKNLTVEK